MKRIFILILISVFAFKANAQQVNFYVVSDADDWQLYMSKQLITDLPGTKVVIITLTAGDEGFGNTTLAGSSLPYYIAREKGSYYSSKFARDITHGSISPNNTYPLPTVQNVVIHGKTLAKYYYGNPSGNGAVVNYFLRLPDGGPGGAGYAANSLKSLMKLKTGAIPSITSVDGVNTYNWAQLRDILKYIIFAEKGTDPNFYLNQGSSNAALYPTETSDHIYTAMACDEAIAGFAWIGIHEHLMDNSFSSPVNLTNEQFENSTALFGVYNWSLVKDKYPSKFNSTVRAVLPMDFSTTPRTPTGTAPILPVTLLTFTGALKGNNVLLEWSTTAEYNSKEFQIEKSNDGVNYTKLGTVAAAGNSTNLRKYNYLDIEATELNYYRLQVVDIDGFTKQSDVVIVKNNGLTQAVTALNNPFKDYINIRFAKIPKGGVTLRLLDLSGKLISINENYNPALSSIIHFDIDKAISRGMYILQVQNEGKLYSIKLVRE